MNFEVIDAASHVERSIEQAKAGKSHADPAALSIKGFSTPTMRHLMNNLCSIPRSTYLEIGCWHGATFCAAVSNNPDLNALGVDDFSQPFGTEDVRASLEDSWVRHITGRVARSFKGAPGAHPGWVEFLDADAFAPATMERLPKEVDILFYDAVHSEEAQRKAMTHFIPCLAETAIIVVDDFQWEPVHRGTLAGLHDASMMDGGFLVDKQWILSDGQADGPIWHNGMAIFVCRKV